MKHPFLLIAAGLAVVSGAALATASFFLEAPIESSQGNGIFFLGVADLVIGAFLLVAVFLRSWLALIVSAIACVPAGYLALMFGFMQFETELSFLQGTQTTQSVLFFIAFAGNVLAVVIAILGLLIGRGRLQQTLASSG